VAWVIGCIVGGRFGKKFGDCLTGWVVGGMPFTKGCDLGDPRAKAGFQLRGHPWFCIQRLQCSGP